MRIPNTIQATLLLPALLTALVLASARPTTAQTPTVTAIYTFTGGTDEANPEGLVQVAQGAFYGTTSDFNAFGNGTIFKITTAGALTTLHTFNGADGTWPFGVLLHASDGYLYGVTYAGGAYGFGSIFRATTAGALTTLYSFNTANNGAYHPNTTLVQATDGNLYGTTSQGGTFNLGTIFRISTSGAFTMLHSCGGANDGGPCRTLIQASDGNLYGTTFSGGALGYGSVFRFTTSGVLTTLYSFSGGADGEEPSDGVIQASDGNLYGTTSHGGAFGGGKVFRISTSGALTTLCSFNEGSDGDTPGAIIQASDGNLYGTTEYAGASEIGTIFRVTLSGTLTTLHSFSGSEGSTFGGVVIQASDGDFYGTTPTGGANDSGTIYRLSGVYPVPIIASFSPSSTNAAGLAFTLKVKGTDFQSFSTVNWNGNPLATTYVSPTALTASVPASLIAAPGKASVTVVTGAGGGTSVSKAFTILTTTLKLSAAKLTRDSGTGIYTANLTFKNVGFLTAPGVQITKASLGSAVTSTTLPVSLGSIAAGSTASASLNFLASAGSSGSVVVLKVLGTFTGGTFSTSLKVTLP